LSSFSSIASQVQWLIPVIPVLRRWRSGRSWFKAIEAKSYQDLTSTNKSAWGVLTHLCNINYVGRGDQRENILGFLTQVNSG
jgi:hypothetical protein